MRIALFSRRDLGKPRGAPALACALLALLLEPATAANAMPTSADVRVTTIAGSGAAGIADGPASRASFIMPFGLAYAPDGTLYVSDGGAQRIRAIDRVGNVRTVAGGGSVIAHGLWVAGAFRDGTGSDARFNGPAGLAWHDGLLYVADTYNRCIRIVDARGNVRTYAGAPDRAGNADGPRSDASFGRPIGLAGDRAGNIYVADPDTGLRMISRDGRVSTIADLSGGGPYGVAAVDTPEGTALFVADRLGLMQRSPKGYVQRFAAPDASSPGTRQIHGFEPLGYPFAIAAFDEDSVVYTDVRGDAIRYLNWPAGAAQILGGADVFDGASSTGGFRNGSGDDSRFAAPMGIAIARGGSIAIADSGSRRIRLLARFDRSHDPRVAGAVLLPGSPPAAGSYTIAFVGNSYLGEYLRWSDSIPGIVERLVGRSAGFTALRRKLRVDLYALPLSSLRAQVSYADFLLKSSSADLVVLNVNAGELVGEAGLSLNPATDEILGHADGWTQLITQTLRTANEDSKGAGTRFVVFTSPTPDSLSLAEAPWYKLFNASQQRQDTPSYAIGDLMNAAVRASGVPFVDGWAVFAAESRSAQHEPLFGTQDPHFSAHGRAVLANALADFLEAKVPWRESTRSAPRSPAKAPPH